jgi:hypothetical protein
MQAQWGFDAVTQRCWRVFLLGSLDLALGEVLERNLSVISAFCVLGTDRGWCVLSDRLDELLKDFFVVSFIFFRTDRA